MNVCILGIGSPSGDDQAGWLVVDALFVSAGGIARVRKLDRPGAGLLAEFENAGRVILVDAMQSGAAAGQIRHFDRTDWDGYRSGLSSHGFGVLEALALARALGSLPERLDLYGIEIASAEPGAAAGPAVREAAQCLAAKIAAELAGTVA